jgi:hypothetical protein
LVQLQPENGLGFVSICSKQNKKPKKNGQANPPMMPCWSHGLMADGIGGDCEVPKVEHAGAVRLA